jgi:response regulator RpfG family c-di-GMP phosphodiesterase
MQLNDPGYPTAQVLVVDDEPDALAALADALITHGYDVSTAPSAEDGIELAKQKGFDLVLCDLYMNGMSGVQFTQAVSRMHPNVPVIVVTAWGDIEASRQALDAGASDFVTKPIEFTSLPFLLENNLQRKKIELRRVSEQRADVLFKAIKGLAAAIDAKSHYTGKHSAHTAEVCLEIGQEHGLTEERMNTLELAAHIHDVGKIGCPDAVLTKPGKLTPEEWYDILRHPAMGADFLAGIDELTEVATIVRHHHERMDGEGYPDGLSGDAIPPLTRILAVADAFEAMTSDRPYRPALSWDDALAELRANAGTQFDPLVVTAAERVVRMALGIDDEERAA